MPEVIKPNRVVRSEHVVLIPDDHSIVSIEISEDDIDGIGDVADGAAEERGDEISPEEAMHIAPKSGEELSQRMMEMARTERERLLEQAQSDAFSIREQAKSEGYQAGYQEVIKRVDDALAEVKRTLDDMQQRQHSYFLDYQKELRFLALDIAAKVVGATIESNETAMADLVRQAVSAVKGADWITVEVSDRLVELIGQLTEEFSIQYPSRQIEVMGSNIPHDSCIIKTSDGIVDASIPVQLQNLQDIFSDMDDIDR